MGGVMAVISGVSGIDGEVGFIVAGVIPDPVTGRAVSYVHTDRGGVSNWFDTEADAHQGLDEYLSSFGLESA